MFNVLIRKRASATQGDLCKRDQTCRENNLNVYVELLSEYRNIRKKNAFKDRYRLCII